jgi:hypothetical protein
MPEPSGNFEPWSVPPDLRSIFYAKREELGEILILFDFMGVSLLTGDVTDAEVIKTGTRR